jgi:cysteine synthase
MNEQIIERTARRCRERGIRIPTFAQMKNPQSIPDDIKKRLRDVGLWDVDPVNLFRITWKNEPKERGGLFNSGNWIEFPQSLTKVPARIVGIVGKHFPTGAHKVGAAFGCLVPRLVSGEFDPTSQKAVWPSTGNYCRGGAFDSALLGCTPVAILPEGMSKERFTWLREIGAEVIATPGTESNVKEIYDECWRIRRTRPDCVIFNQFEEFGNAIWHYHVTGTHIEDVFRQVAKPGDRLSGYASATGSAGTIAAGDYLRTISPSVRIGASEALQCPTLLSCGFGEHRIEGIGDKHVPWIHNIRNTDMVLAIDDDAAMSLLRLFNEPEGQCVLAGEGVAEPLIAQLPLLGISSICNLLSAIKMAKYYEMNSRDVIFIPLTDSEAMYSSRLEEMRESHGAYTRDNALRHVGQFLDGCTVDHLRELNFQDRKQLHNFKYFTWVEQQGRSSEDLRRLWEPEFWEETFAQVDEWDRMIEQFNARVG